MTESADLLQEIRQGIVGRDRAIVGPYGARLITYADYTASGRSLSFIEDLIREHVLPYYANTHSESSATGLQTTRFREDARRIIAESVGATDEDVVIFTGSGATAAIVKLLDIFNLRLPSDLDERYGMLDRVPVGERPVVFIGPYEHHSNELPWRESIADVVVVDEDEDGRPDLGRLEEALHRYAVRPLKIGSFSAGSNVTGIAAPTHAISKLLHRHGALAVWDFAAAGPYVEIEMNPRGESPDAKKDAVVLSPHKFVGGPGTPGVLVVKKRLLTNRVPTVPGGGTVAYVGPEAHRYLEDPAHREEGGTPDIVGAVRAGLVFQLKEAVGARRIRQLEDRLVRRALDRWRQVPELEILGNLDAWRLSIVSFVVRYRAGYLHHNLVVALLNDLFGIQARGGCSCAGPYGHRLLGIDPATSREYEREIMRGCEGIKPGWARLSFNYFVSEKAHAFILDAVEFVARNGWRFLPLYRFSPHTGLWCHRVHPEGPEMSLDEVTYLGGRPRLEREHALADEADFEGYLEAASRLAGTLPESACSELSAEGDAFGTSDDRCFTEGFEKLRWFPLPHEVCGDR